MQIWTNQCTRSGSFYLNVYSSMSSTYTQFVNVQPGCTVRTRQRLVNSAGTDYYYTGWVTSSPKSSAYTTTHSSFTGSKRCFSEWSVRRSDGSWYTRYHYNTSYLNNATFRDICSDS